MWTSWREQILMQGTINLKKYSFKKSKKTICMRRIRFCIKLVSTRDQVVYIKVRLPSFIAENGHSFANWLTVNYLVKIIPIVISQNICKSLNGYRKSPCSTCAWLLLLYRPEKWSSVTEKCGLFQTPPSWLCLDMRFVFSWRVVKIIEDTLPLLHIQDIVMTNAGTPSKVQ